MDYPPDDLTLSVHEWLRLEIYPLHLGEPFDGRACSVWVSGSRGYVSLWQQQYGYHPDPVVRTENIKHELYRRIMGQTEPEPEPGPHPNPLTGALRIEGRGYVHDAGPVIPCACHFGEAFSAYVHGKSVEGVSLLQQLDRIAAAGYHAIRFWDVLGFYDSGWGGREVTPIAFRNQSGGTVQATPDYYGKLSAFLQECHARRLRVLHDRGDLNSWNDTDKYTHCRKVGEVYAALPQRTDILAGFWAVNEAAHNGVHDPAVACRMVENFIAGLGGVPSVLGLSDYDQTESPTMFRAWSVNPATVYTCHPIRDEHDYKRMLEHYFSNGYGMINEVGEWGGAPLKPFFYTEPIGDGAGVSVGRVDNPELLASLAVAAALGGAAYTYMSGFGVFWDGVIGSQAGFTETVRILRWLPQDLLRFANVHHSGSTWQGIRVFEADDAIHQRVDGALHHDGRFAYLAYDPHGAHNVRVARPCSVEVVHPATAEVISRGDYAPGYIVPVAGDVARLLVGRLL